MANRPKPRGVRLRQGGSAARGAVSHRPIPEPLEFAPAASPEVPEGLGEHGARFWRENIVPLIELGVVPTIDIIGAEVAAGWYQELESARLEVEKRAIVAIGSQGQEVVSPYVRVMDIASAQFRRWCSEYGLTPSSRSGLGLAETKRWTLEMEMERVLGPNPRRT